jgi:adenylate kinase family enzyme
MGPTCTGKSTLISYIANNHPDVGVVSVGKILRAKYRASYFKGSGCPQETAEEAWNLCEENVEKFLTDDKKLILIDGQPREVDQVDKILHAWGDLCLRFILLDAGTDVRAARAALRYRPEQVEEIELTKNRLYADVLSNFKVVAHLLKHSRKVEVVCSDALPETYCDKVLHSLVTGEQL